MAHLHQHHHTIHHHSSYELELIHSPPSSVSSSAMASTTTLPQQQASHAHQLHQQSSNPHLQRRESAQSLHQYQTMPIGSPPDHMQYPAQQNGPAANHRRLSSGQQHTSSGLSILQNGETNGNGLQINGSNSQNQQPLSSSTTQPIFDPGRSPPNKNLAHVPCKFFRQNQCQAGRSCPFSHSLDSTTESAPCKYFQKGNCKFGAKCANAHILPDGRRINRPSFNSGPLQLGGRIVPEYQNHRASALHNSLLQANMLPQHAFTNPQAFVQFDGSMEQPNGYDIGYANGVSYDAQFSSPREESGLALSPLASSHRTLGPLDAGLPASLDSNGISWFAKYGPIAASVPSKFGMESPPASLPPNSALRSLHRSAFADDTDGADISRSRRSPPLQPDETSFSQRILQTRLGRTKFQISSSMPRPMSHMTSDESPFDNSEGEDLVPTALLQDVYGDRGKEIQSRRMSRPDHEEPTIGSWQRKNTTAPNTPGEPTSAVGSPSSRFGPLFSRQRKEEDSPISAIGHVGSPLRNSYAQRSSPPFGAIGRPDPPESGSFIASPTRHTSGSNLSQHLQRSRLQRNEGSYTTNGDPNLGVPRTTLGSGTSPQRLSIERNISSSSTGKFSGIDEETQFILEDVDTSSKKPIQIHKPNGLGLELLNGMSNLYVSR